MINSSRKFLYIWIWGMKETSFPARELLAVDNEHCVTVGKSKEIINLKLEL